METAYSLTLRLFAALAIGLLIGIERGWNEREEDEGARIAGIRTFSLIPGIGPSPDKMLLARLVSYADAHRARLGVNYKQIPVNQPKSPVHSYSKGGTMRIQNVSDPVYAPNSKGGFEADSEKYPEEAVWSAEGDFIRAAYTKREDDDDFGQPGTLVRKVMNDEQRDRLVSNVVGHLKAGVSEPVLQRVFDYWRNIDKETGDRIVKAMQEG